MPKFDLKILNVLIAEDDEDDLYLVRQMLERGERKRYRSVHCSTLKQTLAELQCQAFDVLLLDLNLGECQGLKTLEQVVSANKAVPIIVLTGTDDESLGEAAIRGGAEDYLPKAEVTATLLARSITYAIERHALVSQLQRQATTDALTGLPNRNALYQRLETTVENNHRQTATLAVAMLDLDGFKQVNDTLGHRAGDDILRQLAARLRKHLRKTDFVARLGGDEFIVLISHYHSTEELISVIEKKRDELIKPLHIFVKGCVEEVLLGVSTGLAEWQHDISIEHLMSIADSAMYQSKAQGNNTITLATTGNGSPDTKTHSSSMGRN